MSPSKIRVPASFRMHLSCRTPVSPTPEQHLKQGYGTAVDIFLSGARNATTASFKQFDGVFCHRGRLELHLVLPYCRCGCCATAGKFGKLPPETSTDLLAAAATLLNSEFNVSMSHCQCIDREGVNPFVLVQSTVKSDFHTASAAAPPWVVKITRLARVLKRHVARSSSRASSSGAAEGGKGRG